MTAASGCPSERRGTGQAGQHRSVRAEWWRTSRPADRHPGPRSGRRFRCWRWVPTEWSVRSASECRRRRCTNCCEANQARGGHYRRPRPAARSGVVCSAGPPLAGADPGPSAPEMTGLVRTQEAVLHGIGDRRAGRRRQGQHHLRQRRSIQAARDRRRRGTPRRPDRMTPGCWRFCDPANRRRRSPPSGSMCWWFRRGRCPGRTRTGNGADRAGPHRRRTAHPPARRGQVDDHGAARSTPRVRQPAICSAACCTAGTPTRPCGTCRSCSAPGPLGTALPGLDTHP